MFVALKDMASFEMALAPLLETGHDLGRSGSELHAFKQVLFLEDDQDAYVSHLTKLLSWDTALANRNDKNGTALRPSTLLHHALARKDTPATLSSPTDELRIKHQHLVEWLVAGTNLPSGSKYQNCAPSQDSPLLPLIANLSVDSGAHREAHAFAAFVTCLDAYAARYSVSATSNSTTATTSTESSKGDDIYKTLIEQGNALVERYLKSFNNENRK
jgi:hypothetical protein